MTSTIVKQKMFRYIENKDRTFLFGAYRGEKSQLEWILGEKTQRYEKLYNIRFNQDLFSQRNGGTLSKRPKGFILENVEGLVNHDGGKTLQVIVDRLAA